MDRSWIDRFEQGADIPLKSIEELNSNDLSAIPIPQTWSIRQIVLHLYDSDLIGTDRMKRVIAEDSPTLIGYDETAFANKLYTDDLDLATACRCFADNRRLTTAILRRQPDAAFKRIGHHNESGVITLEYLVKTYVGHLERHLDFLLKKRALLGKPIALKVP